MKDEAPETRKVLGMNVVPYEWGVWCSIEGYPKPFVNTIEHVSWSEDGQHLWFMLGTHNFYKARPDEEVELVPCTVPDSEDYMRRVRAEHAKTILNRPQPTKPCAACNGAGKVAELRPAHPSGDQQERPEK